MDPKTLFQFLKAPIFLVLLRLRTVLRNLHPERRGFSVQGFGVWGFGGSGGVGSGSPVMRGPALTQGLRSLVWGLGAYRVQEFRV